MVFKSYIYYEFTFKLLSTSVNYRIQTQFKTGNLLIETEVG